MRCRSTGKVMHRNRVCAELAKAKVKQERGLTLLSYRCASCHRWHLGNTVATRVENMNRIFDRIAEMEAAR